MTEFEQIDPWDWESIVDSNKEGILVVPVVAALYCSVLVASVGAILGNEEFQADRDFHRMRFNRLSLNMYEIVVKNEPELICACCMRDFVKHLNTLRIRFDAFRQEENAKLDAEDSGK